MAYFSVPIDKNKEKQLTQAPVQAKLPDDNTGKPTTDFANSDPVGYGYGTQPTQQTQTTQPQQNTQLTDKNSLVKPQSAGTAGYYVGASTAPSKISGDEVGPWANPYQQQRDDLFAAIMNPGKFNYDLYSDNLYRQYKHQYEDLGQKAMQNTMGQAAALTGGYGSTYAQAAGQQSYYDYLNQLNNIVPTLRQNAYAEWADQEDRKLDQYKLTLDAYDRAENSRENAYANLAALIQSGYVPTDDELQRAGMTKAQARIYEQPSLATSGGYYVPGSSGSGSRDKSFSDSINGNKLTGQLPISSKVGNFAASNSQPNQATGTGSTVNYGVGSIARMPDDVIQQNFTAEWNQARTEAERRAIEDKYTQAINSRR